MHAVDELASLITKEKKIAMHIGCWAETGKKRDVLHYWVNEKAADGHVSARQLEQHT